MRLLIASQFGGLIGGRETYLRAVAPLLRAAGWDVGFALEQPAGPGVGSVVGSDPGPVWRIPEDLAAIATWQPSVAFTHGLSDPAVEASLAARFPTVYFAHGYYGTCISGTKCHARPGYRTCERVLGPACLAVYLPRRCGGQNPLTMLRLYAAQRRSGANLARYAAVVVASRHMADEYARHGVSSERLHTIPYFPTDITPDAAAPAARPRSDRVLFVGRVTALKGWRELLEAVPAAASRLGRRLTLVVAGDGPDRAACEAEAARLGVPAEFLGWVGPDRRQAEMRVADVLAVPSVWPEPFGMVGIEAGCVGLPAVAFAVGGIPEWLTAGVSGELAPGGRPDARQLAESLVRALADDAHWQAMRVGAWAAAGRFTAASHVERLGRTLRQACRDPA